MVINISKIMELSLLILAVVITSGIAQQQQQQQQQQPAQFRQQQEPQFQPPPLLPQAQQQQFNFQQSEQGRQAQGQVGQVLFPQQQIFAQNQQPQQNFQQPQQNFQQQRPQVNFNDFNNRQQQETLPTLPPVFIPPNNPIGPAPQLQSPIRNLFRQPESNTFSISNIFNRFLNLFNLNSN